MLKIISDLFKINNDNNKNYDEVRSNCSNVQTAPITENEHGEVRAFERTAEIEIQENSIKTPLESLDKVQARKFVSESKGETFIIKSANDWTKEAADKPVPKMILGELWYEGEICILFADTNVGKSILAVQIADSLTKGENIEPFNLEIDKKKVIYFDFELTDQQFTRRYSEQIENNYTNLYDFDNDFLRVEINRDKESANNSKAYEQSLVTGIEEAITKSGVEIIIIDNLSCIKSDNENAKDAVPFMQQLKAIKDKHKVSILVLAHTPKRDNSRPLDVNDLAGSKQLSNYADSIFAIGKSQADKNLRYLKQLKERSTEKIYDSENVCIFEIVKADNFLEFEFKDFDSESRHLFAPTYKSREEQIAEAKKLNSQGKAQRAIAEVMSVSVGTVNGWLKESVQLSDTNKMNILNEDEPVPLDN